ncbi:hypothetical protein SPHINGO8AM_30347 [Sphingomonas sp. 8AM]|nr:hypothetical protein SPHINGO8AM_30347 [Sphingomonas sp. 8AM]
MRAQRSNPESDHNALDCFAALAMTIGVFVLLRRDPAAGSLISLS